MATQYFEHKLEVGNFPETPHFQLMEWHPSLNILAVASVSVGTNIFFYGEDGEHDEAARVQHMGNAYCMTWHPVKKTLAVGFSNGELMIWNGSNRRLESVIVHKSCITSLILNMDGTRLLSTDQDGLIILWKADSLAQVSQQSVILQVTVPGESITYVLSKTSPSGRSDQDYRDLARAAVEGDQTALDMLATSTSRQQLNEPATFYVGTDKGNVYMVTDKLRKICSADDGIARLLHSYDLDMLIVVTKVNMMTQYNLQQLQTQSEVLIPTHSGKLSGRPTDSDFALIGTSLFAYVTGESTIRMIDIASSDNLLLKLNPDMGYANNEVLISVSYSAMKGIIAAGTNRGNIGFWVYNPNRRTTDPEKHWILQRAKQIATGIPVRSLKYCPQRNCLAANLISQLFLLTDENMSAAYRDQLAVVQLSPTVVHIAFFRYSIVKEEELDIPFKNLCVSKNHIAIWNKKQVRVYELICDASKSDEEKVVRNEKGYFSCSPSNVILFDQLLFVQENGRVNVMSFQGTSRQTLAFAQNEGEVNTMNSNGSFLVIGSTKGYVKVFDISRRELRPLGKTLNINAHTPSVDTIRELAVNCTGAKVTVLTSQTNCNPSSRLYIWDVEKDIVAYFDFSSEKLPGTEYGRIRQNDNTKNTPQYRRYPSNIQWDPEDSRLIALEIFLHQQKLDLSASLSGDDKTYDVLLTSRGVGDGDASIAVNHTVTARESAAVNQEDMKKTFDNISNFGSSLLKKNLDSVEHAASLIVSMFCTSDNQIFPKDIFLRNASYRQLIAIKIPFYFFVTRDKHSELDRHTIKSNPTLQTSKTDQSDIVDENISIKNSRIRIQLPKLDTLDGSGLIPSTHNHDLRSNGFLSDSELGESVVYSDYLTGKTMPDFIGVNGLEKNIIEAIMNFSYNLTLGDLDAAFKAIKIIKKESVWENLARMCVLNRRADVAKICLGKMGLFRGARALRAVDQDNPDTKIAILAIHLNMKEEAEKILLQSKQYDLLNQLYQSTNEWEKAIDISTRHDRIHLRNTHYNYAKYLEQNNQLEKAIEFYEKSGTQVTEVRRMFLERKDIAGYKAYTAKQNDPKLFRWWGRYFESRGKIEDALGCYRKADDNLSLCRLLCEQDQPTKAIELCSDTGNKAACYHMARYFEKKGDYKQAISYFQQASAISNAMRLCRDHHLDEYMANIAVQGTSDDMLEAARYFQTLPMQEDRAILLYHKAGLTSKAIDLAFKHERYSALAQIADSVGKNVDPTQVTRMADYFMQLKQFDKAVDLLAAIDRVDEAADLAIRNEIPLTEELLERLSPAKPTNEEDMPKYQAICEKLGDLAVSQGAYAGAAKKYLDAGNKIKSMRALIHSGDVERITMFATVARNREVYLLAADYLKTLDWKKYPDALQNIMNFYKKARAYDKLALFYDMCAQIEIEEYRDYNKALEALMEAYKILRDNGENTFTKDETLQELELKCRNIKRFIDAKDRYLNDPETGSRELASLLTDQKIFIGVHPGDLYGILIDHFGRQEKYKQAGMLLDELQEHIPERYFSHYINPNLLSAIYAATGRKMAPPDQPSQSMTYNNDENEDKLVIDDYQNDRRQQQRQGHLGKSHTYAEEIDDNIDYGSVDD
ncbi:unnamed protein product [Rotaria sordida]|uniref:Uncharacterized protein n=1 Tax=Rotaria sordida TaxID=392033 RepID=A0A818NJZ3_9BILA|nr:unnamed protein product [Rotaria sordida]CAF3608193.1 unnamed protein product [Rotaria sordida]